MSDHVELRPVTEEDLVVLDRFIVDPDAIGPFEWLGWMEPDQWRRQWAADRLLGEDGGKLMVVVDEEPVGFVGWQKVATSRTSYCWTINIGLLPEARGQGHGTEAQRLLVDFLFSHTSLHRIEAGTDAANVAEQRALERAGFTRERVVEGRYFSGGRRHDTVHYHVLRDDLRS